MNRITHFFLLFSVLSLLFLTACENDEPTIGNEVINQEGLINTTFTDSLTLTAEVEHRAPLALGQAQVSGVFLFGKTNEPNFGESIANIYTQISPGINNLQFDSLPSLDSVVLTVSFPNTDFVYGDNSTDQEINVFEINIPNPIDRLSEYTSDISYALNQQIGQTHFRFPEEGDSLVTRLNIRLDNDFGTRIIEQSQKANDSTFYNIPNFLDYLNGIALIPGENNSSIGYFDMKSALTRMTIYYKALYPQNLSADDLEYVYGSRTRVFELRNFVIGGTSTIATSVNEFQHDYAGSVVGDLLNSGGESIEDGYLQGMAGTQMRVKIPHLHNLGNIVIHSAVLEVTAIEEEEDSFYPLAPSIEMRLDPIDVPNSDIARLTYLDYASPAFGVSETDSISDQMIRRYELPIPFSIQRLLSEEPNNRDIILRIPEDGTNNITGSTLFLNPYQVKLAGPNHPDFPMKLKLYYTEVQ